MTRAHSTASDATFALLTRIQDRGVGPAALRKMLGFYSDSSEALNAMGKPLPESWDKAKAVRDACEDAGVRILSPWDEGYPTDLRSIDSYPPLLFVRGSLDALSKRSVAVVGTRDASHAGRKLARRIAGLIAERGFTVTSGLALGIDSEAHRGALDAKGTTVAVMAHGLDTVSPNSNRELAEEIVRNGGALVSEHAPGVKPHPPEFVRRNRIQSGMSVASIIVESGVKGGAIHQARFTCEQGRRLFVAWPHGWTGAEEFNSEGAKFLIEECAAERLATSQQLLERLQIYSSGESDHADRNRTLDLFD